MVFNDFRVNVLVWRNLLVSAWRFSCDESDANCAHMLLKEALKRGLTERQELKGRTLCDWPKRNKSPEWACIAAFYLLLEIHYLPDKDECLAAFVFFWLSEKKCDSAEIAMENFPDHLKVSFPDRVDFWINSFFNI